MMLSSETDIKIRKGQAWGAFWKMKDIWKSMKYNEKIMKLGKSALNKNTKQEPIVQTIQRRQFRFIGHCLRRDKEEFTYQYALYTPQPRHGKRKQGRPKLLYPEYIAKLINNEVQQTIDELREIAVERTKWSKFVVDCKPRLFSAEQ